MVILWYGWLCICTICYLKELYDILFESNGYRQVFEDCNKKYNLGITFRNIKIIALLLSTVCFFILPIIIVTSKDNIDKE